MIFFSDPYSEDSSDGSEDEKSTLNTKKPILVDIDLDLSAFANARRYG